MFNTIFLQDAAAANSNPGMMNLLFIIGIIVVFYFFMIRPQKQQQKKIEEERNNMKVGDNIVTANGMFGKIDGINTAVDQKGRTYVESFIIRLKPDYQTRVQISKDCVFKDMNDAISQAGATENKAGK